MVPINYLAVVVAAIAGFAIGGLWYGPLFGKQWAGFMGWSAEVMAAKQAKGGMGKNYALMFVGTLLMSFVLSHALVFASTYLKVTGISAGLQTGFWNWLGFIAPVTMGVILWEGKPWKLWFINAGYYLVSLLAMGIILALWTV